MRHSMINGEAVEYVLLSTHSPDLDTIDYRYGVKLYDYNGNLVWQEQMSFHETASMRRRDRRIKVIAAERIVARMRVTSEVIWEDDVQQGDRIEALEDLFTHLRQARRGV